MIHAEDNTPGRWFVPEASTHLYYSSVYPTLSYPQKLAYNRLHACSICELIAFVEESLPSCYLKAMTRPNVDSSLRDEVLEWAEAERRHAAMFHRLAESIHPQLYPAFEYRFMSVSPRTLRAVASVLYRPTLFPLFFWLGLLAEERASHYGAEIVRQSAHLDPAMVDVHRRHLRDEAGHLRLDELLLSLYWNDCGPWVRRLNAKLFRWMVGEFLCAPKRGAIRLIDYWLQECPELAPRKAELLKATRSVGQDRRYHESLYSRHTVPKTFALFDRSVEFRDLGKSLWAYSPEAAE